MAKGTIVRTTKSPEFRTVRCKATKGLTKWCYAMCQPVNGYGLCGRPAAHAVTGRTQRAIAKYLATKKAAEKRAHETS